MIWVVIGLIAWAVWAIAFAVISFWPDGTNLPRHTIPIVPESDPGCMGTTSARSGLVTKGAEFLPGFRSAPTTGTERDA